MYYIYHIPGKKIGCTNNIKRRMRQQGFTEWEILETYEDGWVAGDREIELQKEYGYPVDTTHYMISIQNRFKWNDNARHIFTLEERSEAGKIGGSKTGAVNGKVNRKITFENAQKIRELKGKVTQRKLAEQHGVTTQTIKRIHQNKTYLEP